jgi:hypothetical protein
MNKTIKKKLQNPKKKKKYPKQKSSIDYLPSKAEALSSNTSSTKKKKKQKKYKYFVKLAVSEYMHASNFILM